MEGDGDEKRVHQKVDHVRVALVVRELQPVERLYMASADGIDPRDMVGPRFARRTRAVFERLVERGLVVRSV